MADVITNETQNSEGLETPWPWLRPGSVKEQLLVPTHHIVEQLRGRLAVSSPSGYSRTSLPPRLRPLSMACQSSGRVGQYEVQLID